MMGKHEKNTRPTVGAVEQATGNGLANDTSHTHFTSIHVARQTEISDYLGVGQENAIPLRHLMKITGENGRIVRRKIAAERLAGVPILADNQNGYFLPATAAEAQRCVRSMRHRAREIERAAEAIAAATGEA